MNKLKLLLAGIIAMTIIVSGSSLLLPQPADAEVRAYYSPLATSVVLVDVMLALGSGLLFWSAIKHFKPELRTAYRLMAYSTIAVGLGLIIFPYIEYYGLWDNLWLNMASYLQYLIGAPLMYLGVRMFYKRVGLQGKVSSIWLAVAAIAVLSGLHVFLPINYAWPLTIWQYNLFKIVTIIPFVLYGVTGYMAWRMRQRAGHEYTHAFTWLTISMVFYVINALGIVLFEAIGYENPYYELRLYTAPAILGDLCLIATGFAFAAIGLPKTAKQTGEVTSMDIIIYLAGKSSSQRMIDPYLDELRSITAHMQPGQNTVPTAEDQARLRDTYLRIEDFLVKKDTLRTFSPDTLRADIAHRFGLEQNAGSTFWPLLQPHKQ